MSNSYNGWSNRETWLVNVHFNPESQSDLDWAKEQIEVWYDGLGSFMQDMVDLGAIDWQELADAMDDEESEENEK